MLVTVHQLFVLTLEAAVFLSDIEKAEKADRNIDLVDIETLT